MIDLGLNFFPAVFFNACNVNFIIKVADVTNNGLVFHACHMVMRDHMVIAGCRYKDIGFVCCVIHRDNAVAFHCCLQCADRIDFRYPNLSGQGAQGLC